MYQIQVLSENSVFPAFDKNNIPIILTSSAYYVPYMAVTIQSIVEISTIENNYDVLILGNNIPEEDQIKICSIAKGKPNISIRFIRLESMLANMDYNFREGYSVESFYRVLLMEFLPKYNKVLYLDSDVIVLKDIAELYSIDIKESLVAAVRDPDGIKCYYQNYKNRALYMDEILQLSNQDNYFQSGVMLFQLEIWRKTYTIQDLLDVACSSKLLWGDQDALNILCKDRVYYLDMAWNTIVDGYGGRVSDVKEWAPEYITTAYLKAREKPYIVHYAGVQPWKNPNVDMNEYFWKIAQKSLYFKLIKQRAEENKHLLNLPKTRIVTGARYAVSVIIPIYNAESTLEETILSIINQTIGFKKYIQLILVNNATQDNSEKICLKYVELYPNNIKYIKLNENHGPNGARVAGLNYVEGKYINFLDADDKWELSAFEKIFDYFEAHYFEVPFVACRIKHFGFLNSWNIRDDKFTCNRVIDINRDYNIVQQSICSCWIKKSVFDEVQLAVAKENIHGEDGMFLTKVAVLYKKFALLKNAVFYYRRYRPFSNSLLSNRLNDKSWYLNTIEKNYLSVISYDKKINGKLSWYTQNWLVIELSDRILKTAPECLTDEEFSEYRNFLKNILNEIEDHIIWENKNQGINLPCKYALSYLKYGDGLQKLISIRHDKFYLQNLPMYSLAQKYCVSFDIMEIKQGTLYIKGKARFFLPDGSISLSLKSSNNHNFIVDQSSNVCERDRIYCLGEEIPYCTYIKAEVPLRYVKDLSLYLEYKNQIHNISFGLGKFSACTRALRNDYYWNNGYMLTVDDNKIKIIPCGPQKAVLQEMNLFKELWTKGKRKVALLRITVLITRLFKRKEIWLISDRITDGGDSGEVFFKYVCGLKLHNIKPIFIISKSSEAYQRLKTYGTVVKYGGWIHKYLFTLADKIVSSLTNVWNYDLMPYNSEIIRSIWRAEFIHIQHGVIKDDISDSINCYEKNIKIITTASKYEYDSILNNPYGYDKSNVVLTGLARHDTLRIKSKTNNKKILLIAPTWRLYLAGKYSSQEDRFLYSETLKKSHFYAFFNSVINDKHLLECMERNHVFGYLKLHPMMKDNAVDFQYNDIIQSYSNNLDLNPENISLLVTDYSSIIFDYAFLGIPSIYAQFDKSEFYAAHSYKEGYFDYENMGFGPVCYDYESTVAAIIKAIENNCVMDEKYKNRVNNFFAYHDNRNCERIYQEILKLDKE